MANKHTPSIGKGAKYWQSQSTDDHLGTCIFIFLGEFFSRINSYRIPLMSHWLYQDQVPIAEPGSTIRGLSQSGVIPESSREAGHRIKIGTQAAGGNVIFPSVAF